MGHHDPQAPGRRLVGPDHVARTAPARYPEALHGDLQAGVGKDSLDQRVGAGLGAARGGPGTGLGEALGNPMGIGGAPEAQRRERGGCQSSSDARSPGSVTGLWQAKRSHT